MRWGQVVLDVAPLRASPAFRLIVAAQAISMIGTHLTIVAVNLQVFLLTGSSLQVGLVGFVFGMSLLAGLLTGGVLADRVDRRTIVLSTRAVVVAVFAGLAVNAALPQPSLWFVYVAAVLAGSINGLGNPALLAVTPTLVAGEHLPAAGALTALTTQVGAIGGPALAGVLAAGPGLAVCFALDALSFVISVVLLAFLPSLPPPETGQNRHPVRSVVEGLQFVRHNHVIAGLLLIDVLAMVFAMPYALFPELGTVHFGGDATTVGLLYSAPAVGAFVAALLSGWAGRVPRTGALLIGSVVLWGLSIAFLGLTASLWVALGVLVVAGLADTTSEILRRALLHHYTPEGLQGRVGSLWLAQSTVSPGLGNMTAGLLARLTSAPLMPLVGGVICVVGAVSMAVAMPRFRTVSLHDRST
ncbi:MAG: enterobactin transporter EntS [Actinomycetota bacterium]|nr:enterobactin transporter EntS [Actinomycetota bacterium]